MSYDNTNRWTLNKNTDKQTETHADYKGKINVNGVEYWLNGWIKDGPNGKFISGTIKQKDVQQQPTMAATISQRAMSARPDPISSGRHLPPKQSIMPADDMTDDIPF